MLFLGNYGHSLTEREPSDMLIHICHTLLTCMLVTYFPYLYKVCADVAYTKKGQGAFDQFYSCSKLWYLSLL